MESLFDMQRFDPDAEAAGEEPLQANNNLDNLKHKLKRKLDESKNVTKTQQTELANYLGLIYHIAIKLGLIICTP